MVNNWSKTSILLASFTALMLVIGNALGGQDGCLHGCNDLYLKDFLFITNTLFENHPGTYNEKDPSFKQKLLKNHNGFYNKLKLNTEPAKRKDIIKQYIASFNDVHLQISYDKQINCKAKLKKCVVGKNSFLKPKIIWITIPTFDIRENKQINQIKKTMTVLKNTSSNNTIIFDLRGNTGGNSIWGSKIAQSLFGIQCSLQRSESIRQHVYVSWRASRGNLAYIKQLINNCRSLKLDPETTEYLEEIKMGMAKAYEAGFKYYIEFPKKLKNKTPAECFAPKQIILIIDNNCVSACLDFIDEVKAISTCPITLLGQETKGDSIYIDIRKVTLPSLQGVLYFPMKVYFNRLRGNNETFKPDVKCPGNILFNDELLKKFVMKWLENLAYSI